MIQLTIQFIKKVVMVTSFLSKFADILNYSNNSCEANTLITENIIRDGEIHIAKELIKEKININKENPDQDKIIDDILQRLIDSNDLKKVNGSKFSKKITQAINSIAAFGSVPQVYKDEPKLKRGEDVKNLVKFLYTDIGISSEIISINSVKALLIRNNKPLLHATLKEFERVSQKIVEKLNSKTHISPHKQMLTEIFIGNLLAIVPYCEPDDGQIVSFPQYINNKWQSVSYSIDRIQLTPNELGDPLYAYGLVPVENKSAPPLLLFMGTPPSTSTGAKLAEWIDFAPGYAIGEIAYEYAEDKLVNWINNANKQCEKKVQLYGQSLGGSLSLICASTHPDKIGKVFAYNPPAPTDKILSRYKVNSDGIVPPQVNVYNQKNDLVCSLGNGWDKSWNVYRVIPQQKKPFLFFAHIQGFTGQKNVLVHKIDALKDRVSKTRIKLNKIFEVVKKPIFVYKTAALKWSIVTRNHTFFSFISKINNLGIGQFFGMLFSQPNQDKGSTYIQNLLDEVKKWERDPYVGLI
jgi:Putative esterase